MKTVLLLHGIQGYAGIHWQKWLHDKLLKRNFNVLMPELPNPQKPDRKKWLNTIIKLTKNINPADLIIVGHSLGVATALDMIEAGNKKIYMMVSVSGFAIDFGAELISYFLKDKSIDFVKVKSMVSKAMVIYGDNDSYVPQKTLRKLAKDLEIEPTILKNGGHLNTDSGFTTFPLLLRLIILNTFDFYKAGAVIIKDRKVLFLKSHNIDVLIAPGGKIEVNESPEEALIRELFEELSITTTFHDIEKLGIYTDNAIGRKNKNKTICMEVFLIKEWEGEIKPANEIEKIYWFDSSNIAEFNIRGIISERIMPQLKKSGLID